MGDLCVAFLCGVVAIRSARNGSTEASIRAGVEEEGRSPSTRLLIEGWARSRRISSSLTRSESSAALFPGLLTRADEVIE